MYLSIYLQPVTYSVSVLSRILTKCECYYFNRRLNKTQRFFHGLKVMLYEAAWKPWWTLTTGVDFSRVFSRSRRSPKVYTVEIQKKLRAYCRGGKKKTKQVRRRRRRETEDEHLKRRRTGNDKITDWKKNKERAQRERSARTGKESNEWEGKIKFGLVWWKNWRDFFLFTRKHF